MYLMQMTHSNFSLYAILLIDLGFDIYFISLSGFGSSLNSFRLRYHLLVIGTFLFALCSLNLIQDCLENRRFFMKLGPLIVIICIA